MDYTPELGKAVCEDIACGLSVKQSCEERGWTERSFFRQLAKDEKLCQDYALAREARSHSRAESIDQIKARLDAGELDYNTARVLIDATKWQAAHEKPKVYGDKLDVTGIPANSSPALMLSVRERIRRLKQVKEQGPETLTAGKTDAHADVGQA